jgi:hypothetical protein
MAIQTPTHIHYLWVNSNSNIGNIPMTALAVQACRNVGAVREVDEVWHLGHGHPGDFCIIGNEVF